MIFRVILVHRSPYWALAVGGGLPSQKLTLTLCPTPMGLGETTRNAYVSKLHGGVWAPAIDIEAVRDIDRSATTAMANSLFFKKCIFYSPIIGNFW